MREMKMGSEWLDRKTGGRCIIVIFFGLLLYSKNFGFLSFKIRPKKPNEKEFKYGRGSRKKKNVK